VQTEAAYQGLKAKQGRRTSSTCNSQQEISPRLRRVCAGLFLRAQPLANPLPDLSILSQASSSACATILMISGSKTIAPRGNSRISGMATPLPNRRERNRSLGHRRLDKAVVGDSGTVRLNGTKAKDRLGQRLRQISNRPKRTIRPFLPRPCQLSDLHNGPVYTPDRSPAHRHRCVR
jgi:hypothetical protein